MNKLITIITLLSVFLISPLQAQEKRNIDSLVFTKFYSKVLNEDRKIVVHLPLNYSRESSKKYPVMYVLDAGKLDFDTSDRLFALSSSGLVPECIVVGIVNNKNSRERDLTPPFMQIDVEETTSPAGQGDRFLSHVEAELIPLIDSCYRTTGYKTISGHSRAGLFVLYTLIERPNLFNAHFCFSTPAWRFDNIIVHRLESSLRKQQMSDEGYLFLSVGENENANIKSSFDFMRLMLKKLNLKKLKWDSYVTPMANHQTNPIYSTAKGLMCWSKKLMLK